MWGSGPQGLKPESFRSPYAALRGAIQLSPGPKRRPDSVPHVARRAAPHPSLFASGQGYPSVDRMIHVIPAVAFDHPFTINKLL
jgi:hypothetical protein